jgi:hypothetical protein
MDLKAIRLSPFACKLLQVRYLWSNSISPLRVRISSTDSILKRRTDEFDVAFLADMAKAAPGLIDADDRAVLEKAGIITPEVNFAEQERLAEIIPELDREVLTIEAYNARCSEISAKWKTKKILSKYWMPEAPELVDLDFWAFINSTHQRLCDMIAYEPFWLYIEQARRWEAKNERYDQFTDKYERDIWAANERARITVNTLYFANKYAKIKEPDEPRYVANLAHALLMFLFDQKRLYYNGKPRQMAFTTTMGICACKELICHQSSTQVFIAHDKESGQTILEDKVKFVYGHLEEWMKLPSLNDPDGAFRISHDLEAGKGTQKTKSSSINTRTPSVTAINSRSPQIIWIDEAPFIPIFDKMMREGRTTLFGMDMKTGRMRWKRRLITGGTGGATDIGKGVFEREFKGLISKWHRKDFSEGIVPIFLDWTARPGITPEVYLSEREAYAAGNKDGQTHMSLQERMVQFRNHFPSSVDDMFNASKATIVPWSMIINQIDRVARWRNKGEAVTYGRFEPIYSAEPMPKGSPVPFKIIGANWVPMADDDFSAPVSMWMQPDKRWAHRYYQGTDPIQHDAGQSKMASSIWDAHYGTVACIVNHRSDDPNESYMQVALMGMYYAQTGERFVHELVESALMAGYVSFKVGPWLDGNGSLVRKMQLPDHLRGMQQGINSIGVDNKGTKKGTIVGLAKDALMDHMRKIFIPDLLDQLRHFVATPTKGIRGSLWGSEDTMKYQDDVVMAFAFSYICRMCYNGLVPIQMEELQKQINEPRPRLRRDPETQEQYYVMA